MAVKKLSRLTKDKKIAGVCAGLAQYFNIDPAIVRIIFLLSVLIWGVSVIVYIVCWFCIPKEHE